MNVTVYDAEKADGLEDLVAKGTVSVATAIRHSEARELSEQIQIALASANKNQKDLYYKHAILASVGWNANDDVFPKVDTWNARNSVVDKQINLEHNELNIVGHMTDSFVFNENGERISDNSSIDEIPDKFDIVNEFVLYKLWENEDRAQAMSSIIDEIEQGQWFVSMECRFPAFDYALVDANGNQKIVARDKSTAFLTKHLRAYGGSGQYKDYKIGRLLRDFFFSGQGIVKVPANKRSIIFDISTIQPFKSQGSLIIKDNKMDLEQQLAEAKAQLEQVKNAEIETLKQAKATLETEITTLKSEHSSVIASKDTAIANLTSEFQTLTEQYNAVKAEMDSMKKEMKKKARKEKLATCGLKEEELEATLAKWESVDDTVFDSFVEVLATRTPKVQATEEVKVEEVVEEKVVEKVDVEEVVEEPDAPLVQASASTADRVQKISEYLANTLTYSAKANKKLNK